MPQAGIVYRCFPVEATHDISTDQMVASLDEQTWVTVPYLAPADYPPEVIAANAAKPVKDGYTRYWWRILTGPGQPLELPRGYVTVIGKLTDNPEIPQFAWSFVVGAHE